MRTKALVAAILAASLAVSTPAHAADTLIEWLEINTLGGWTAAGTFDLSSRVFFWLTFEGGAKFAATLSLGYVSASLERDLWLWGRNLGYPTDPLTAEQLEELYDRVNNPSGPVFRLAEVAMLDLWGSGIDLSWFIGELAPFGSGADFPAVFGSAPFATENRGYAAWPDGIGGDRTRYYDGIYAIRGTGLKLQSSFGLRWLRVALYGYQDLALGEGGFYSADLRAMADLGVVKLELFGGATFPDFLGTYPLGLYRGGLLFDVKAGEIGEFYAQLGVPGWNPVAAIGLSDLYFLLEPRVNFGIGSFVTTLFVHPKTYGNEPTGEENVIDLSFRLMFGTPTGPAGRGGASITLTFDPASSLPLEADASLYYALVYGGVQLEAKVSATVLPFDVAALLSSIRPYFGVRTSF